MKKVCKNRDYCNAKESNRAMKYHEGQKFIKTPFNVYADIESLLEKTHACKNNLNNLSITKTPNILHAVIHYPHSVQLKQKKINMQIL